jgi:hypothetical protein
MFLGRLETGPAYQCADGDLQYGQGPVITLPRNRQNFAWVAEDSSLKGLDEELSINAEKNDQRVEAEFEAHTNQTFVVRRASTEDQGDKARTRFVAFGNC